MNRIASSLPLVILCTALFGMMAPARRQRITARATTCNESDVANALAKATTDGDIVSIPAGTCSWTTPLVVALTASITIEGAGAEYATAGGASTAGSDLTVIDDDVNHGGSGLPAIITVATTFGKSLRITGIAVLQTPSSIDAAGKGLIQINGTSPFVRVDHCHFYSYYSGNKDLQLNGDVLGVADHDFFDAAPGIVTNDLSFYNGVGWNGGSSGDHGNESWADGDHWGTNKFFYAEDDFFNYGWTSDCHFGGRYVIRYSTGYGVRGVEEHGLGGDIGRSCRASEFYHNNFTYSNTPGTYRSSLLDLNGGTALAWANATTNYQRVVSLALMRQSNVTYNQQAPPNEWGYCGGAPYTQGPASVSSGSTSVSGTGFSTAWPSGSMIIVPGASCTVNSKTGDTCAISSVQSSTALTLASAAGAAITGVTYTVGSPWDGNSKPSGYPCMDGDARGAGNLLSGTYFPNVVNTVTGTQSWPNEVLDPVYAWGNNYNPPGTSTDAIIADGTGTLTDNVDYYQQFGAYGEPGTFNGTAGIGQGTLAQMSTYTTCAAGVGFWATDADNGNGELYVCGPSGNAWAAYYTPYAYPHPLQGTPPNTPALKSVVAH